MDDDNPATFGAPSHYQLMCTATGNLFLMWARMENTLAASLRMHLIARIAGTDSEKTTRAACLAAAIYGSMRLKASRDTLKRLATEEGIEKPVTDFITDVFAHISHIEELRDKLAHQLFEPTDGTGFGQSMT